MREMTDQEAEYWDEYYTKNTIMPDPDKPGYFARKGLVWSDIDAGTAAYLRAQAAATGQTQAQIIAGLVREKLAKSA
jgi:hypothetical protein